jgi:hypothetical protein
MQCFLTSLLPIVCSSWQQQPAQFSRVTEVELNKKGKIWQVKKKSNFFYKIQCIRIYFTMTINSFQYDKNSHNYVQPTNRGRITSERTK